MRALPHVRREVARCRFVVYDYHPTAEAGCVHVQGYARQYGQLGPEKLSEHCKHQPLPVQVPAKPHRCCAAYLSEHARSKQALHPLWWLLALRQAQLHLQNCMWEACKLMTGERHSWVTEPPAQQQHEVGRQCTWGCKGARQGTDRRCATCRTEWHPTRPVQQQISGLRHAMQDRV